MRYHCHSVCRAWQPSALRVAIACALTLGPATAQAASEMDLAADAVAHRELVYATRPNGPVKLDLFKPPGDGPFPLILWIHGGGWVEGNKSTWPHMQFLVGEGFAVANVEYRFSPIAPFPAQLDDVTSALDFLADHAAEYHLDPTRVAVTGESAGGHLAALLGMARSALATTRPTSATGGRVRAVIDLFGPTDLADAAADPKLAPHVEQLIGGPLATHRDVAAAASPLAQVGRSDPPFLVLHGTKDTLVPIGQSERLVSALRREKVPVDFVPVEGAGHAGPMFWTPELRARMVAFLREHLDVASPTTRPAE